MSSPRRWTGGATPLWSVTPPPPKVKKYDRLKIATGKGETLVIVSSGLQACLTHFVDKRTVPCTGEQDTCWLDHRDVGKPRYAGWLAVQIPNAGRVYLLSLTPVAVSVEPRLQEKDRVLRGLTIRVWRSGNNERTEMHCKLQLDVPRVVELPVEPDLRYCIERMWAAEDRVAREAFKGKGLYGRAFAANGNNESK